MTIDPEFFDHFPPVISEKLADYVRDEVFIRSRYIFTQRVGKLQIGYCTHCKKTYQTSTSTGQCAFKHMVSATAIIADRYA
jgi:hypothetical protein